MAENKIKLATTDPRLKDRISINLSGDLDNIYWYIKFNIALDETTVTAKNMNVTDTDGYIMRTEIRYDTAKNLIVVSPLDSYMEGIFYILNISKKVKSQKGQPLKKEIHILFKLTNGQISEYELLKSTVKTPKPVTRPKNYDTMMVEKYSIPVTAEEKVSKNTLDYKDININILVCIIGLVLIVVSLYFMILPLAVVSIIICVVGIIHVVAQVTKADFRSAVRYNFGVMHFNNGNYEKAKVHFLKAAKSTPSDEEVLYALNKVKFYE